MKENVLQVLDLLYPHSCLYCAMNLVKGEDYLCLNCVKDLPLIPWNEGECPSVANQLKGKILFEKTYSHLYYFKSGITGRLLKEIKYRGNYKLAYHLGKQFGNSIVHHDKEARFDFIVPIPLHPKRILKRGYNQAEWIAKGLSEAMGVPILGDAIARVRHNKSQTMKGRQERIKTAIGLFKVVNQNVLPGKHILVIDDVITTGATIEALFHALKSYDNVKISVSALCSPYE